MERSDDELIAVARQGEPEAFDHLMRRYERLVYRVVAGAVGEREDALDLTQAVFLKAFRSVDTFRGESSFKTWLLRIAYHEAANHQRSATRRGVAVELEAGAGELTAPPEQEEALLRREGRGRLEQALAALHCRYRTAILLRYQDGLAIRDIAAVLSVSETMTKNLLFRGVRQLRRAVAPGS